MKSTTFLTICSLLISIFSFGQTSTEQFETESVGSTSFTDNGVIFNIISHTSTFNIVNFPNTGWNGNANDNRYIDNTSNVSPQQASFSVKTTSNLFKVNRFWVYVSDRFSNQNAQGTLTITGKLSGVTKFSTTKTNNFATSLGNTNGYTLIDLTNLNGQNYSNIVIDQLQLTLGGNYYYLGFDAFMWVKDSNIVLAAHEAKAAQKGMQIYPNPTEGPFTITTEKDLKAEVYSMDGKLMKRMDLQKGTQKADLSEFPAGTYLIKTLSGSSKIIKK
ncbi:MAG: T9SS type A sorting domain-containing protein [Chryseobacterium sp.]|jgi:hypothetical protein|uniref:T9SS type A sorting domain-containing protein n=1 Tax=Chryseobacterium sp. TaxID=1871047 RepID=UPI0028278AAD|nr:T9SS type A sorting domain-containing protein [Chryseobacterium sp.]MDR2237200.1 T9SS type A sorting domain-containing protein [Chryseobacterium sp.]